MAKELPYFRFTVQEWQNGNISLERYELQGLFISICGYYWIQNCNITLTMLQKKFRDAKNMIEELLELEIIKLKKNGENIEINFLDIQKKELTEKKENRSKAGRIGGLRKASNAKALLKQNASYKDKDKDKDNIKTNKKIDDAPSVTEFLTYAKSLKEVYHPSLDFQIKTKYESWLDNDWKDGYDKQIKNWKTKLKNTIPHMKKDFTTHRAPSAIHSPLKNTEIKI